VFFQWKVYNYREVEHSYRKPKMCFVTKYKYYCLQCSQFTNEVMCPVCGLKTEENYCYEESEEPIEAV